MSVIVRIAMFIKCRPLWGDEADLAANIISRNWFELLVPPFDYCQAAPIFYVVIEKIIGSLGKYTESFLRLYSLLIFICLLICETLFMRKVFDSNNYYTFFVVVMSALLPSYIWYSNELKPYMSDPFFVVLTIFVYYFYTQKKIRLSVLTVLCILFLGFSSPVIFFSGGIFLSEFLIAIFNKNKKQILNIVIYGIIILIVFGLYYYWWFLPVAEYMKIYWTHWHNQRGIIIELLELFTGFGNSDSKYVWGFVPVAILGFYSLFICRNKIAYMVVLSLLLAFLASSIGKWPLANRLWLFLPVIIFIFTTIGFEFINKKINNKYCFKGIKFYLLVLFTIYLSVNCLTYIGKKMYIYGGDISPLISYIQKNIKEGEKLYVHKYKRTQVHYKIGYFNKRIGNVEANNIIYDVIGVDYFDDLIEESGFVNDLLAIIDNTENERMYLIPHGRMENAMGILRNYGTLTEVMNVQGNPLYYFELNGSKGSEY
jgi:hypothetical protein